jgi:predicted O-methyltransferase YrrM
MNFLIIILIILIIFIFKHLVSNLTTITLDEHLNTKGQTITEGYTQQNDELINQLINLSKDKKKILEIGFNAGHSADMFLSNNTKNAKVLSFDIGEHEYMHHGKEYIDNKFPGRHTLVIGDSTKTIPVYKQNSVYDLIFIDGGHSYSIAKADLMNSARFADKNTIVIMDDTRYDESLVQDYTTGPTKAWVEGIADGTIKELGHKDYSKHHGMSWGVYLKPYF